jgi:hypothetical protein
VAFASSATNLVENDTNGLVDVFVHAVALTNVAPPLIVRDLNDGDAQGVAGDWQGSARRSGDGAAQE